MASEVERKETPEPTAAVPAAGCVYFALEFLAGCVLGVGRVLWLVPRLGERWAELAEMPLMLAAAYLAARWTVRRFRVPLAAAPRLAMGGIGLLLLIGAELGLVLTLRGLTLAEYFESRDPVSGVAYLLSLAAFAVLPLLVARGQGSSGGGDEGRRGA